MCAAAIFQGLLDETSLKIRISADSRPRRGNHCNNIEIFRILLTWDATLKPWIGSFPLRSLTHQITLHNACKSGFPGPPTICISLLTQETLWLSERTPKPQFAVCIPRTKEHFLFSIPLWSKTLFIHKKASKQQWKCYGWSIKEGKTLRWTEKLFKHQLETINLSTCIKNVFE